MFSGLVLTDHAKTAQLGIRDFMRAKGYFCRLEVFVNDRKTPRRKSIFKLKNFNATKKYVICRNDYIKGALK